MSTPLGIKLVSAFWDWTQDLSHRALRGPVAEGAEAQRGLVCLPRATLSLVNKRPQAGSTGVASERLLPLAPCGPSFQGKLPGSQPSLLWDKVGLPVPVEALKGEATLSCTLFSIREARRLGEV